MKYTKRRLSGFDFQGHMRALQLAGEGLGVGVGAGQRRVQDPALLPSLCRAWPRGRRVTQTPLSVFYRESHGWNLLSGV
jgi:hypothetical protein